MKIVIIDYGMGNIQSVMGALNYLGATDVIVSHQANHILSADKLILPGVSAFGHAMHAIKTLKLDEHLNVAILDKKIPILGICLGMQLLMKSSVENGDCLGLGYIDGVVTRLDTKTTRVPHVGFNQVRPPATSRLFQGLEGSPDFYFSHSFKVESNQTITPTYCDYGVDFIAAYEWNNIFGVQFHPELSQTNGLTCLNNFLESA